MKRCKLKRLANGIFLHHIPKNKTQLRIRTMLSKYMCARNITLEMQQPSFFTRKCSKDFRSDNGVVVAAFVDKVHKEVNMFFTKNKVYQTTVEAKRIIFGKHKEQYKLI